MKLLADYLERFSWSQAELARQADVSVSTIGRAIRGETITKHSGQAIIAALDTKYRQSGGKGHITKGSLRDFHTRPARRKRKRIGQPERMTEEEQAYQEMTEEEQAYQELTGQKQ